MLASAARTLETLEELRESLDQLLRPSFGLRLGHQWRRRGRATRLDTLEGRRAGHRTWQDCEYKPRTAIAAVPFEPEVGVSAPVPYGSAREWPIREVFRVEPELLLGEKGLDRISNGAIDWIQLAIHDGSHLANGSRGGLKLRPAAATDKRDFFPQVWPPRADSFKRWLGSARAHHVKEAVFTSNRSMAGVAVLRDWIIRSNTSQRE